MTEFGKLFIIIGLLIAAVGGFMILLGALSLPKLPGDIVYKSDNVTFFFPITTCILLSIVLTIIMRVFYK